MTRDLLKNRHPTDTGRFASALMLVDLVARLIDVPAGSRMGVMRLARTHPLQHRVAVACGLDLARGRRCSGTLYHRPLGPRGRCSGSGPRSRGGDDGAASS
jgi:hypothetical protein